MTVNLFDNRILVTNETRWQCQQCGACCRVTEENRSFMASLLGEPKADGSCKNLAEKNLCRIYTQRPMICQLYPFFPDMAELKTGVVNLSIGKLTIDPHCPGIGKGELVIGNEKLKEKLAKLAGKIKLKMNLKREGKLKEIFYAS